MSESIEYKTITQKRATEMEKIVQNWLMEYIDDCVDYWKEEMGDDTSTFAKVEVDWEDDLGDQGKYTYGYDKYYMAHANGSYEYSIQNMIFMLMMNLGFYEEILMPEEYKVAVEIAKDYPNNVYYIESWDETKSDEWQDYAEEAEDYIMDIMYNGVQAVGERLCEEFGLETVSEYEGLECQECQENQ